MMGWAKRLRNPELGYFAIVAPSDNFADMMFGIHC